MQGKIRKFPEIIVGALTALRILIEKGINSVKIKLLFTAAVFSFLFSVCNISVADQVTVQTLDLDGVVKISEYILKVEKISGNRYKVTELLFGVIDKDGPNKGKEINIADYSRNNKSWIVPEYIPDYMRLISGQVKKAHQNAQDIEGKILDIDSAHLRIFHSLDEKTSGHDGRAMELMGETSRKIRSIRQEVRSLQEYLASLEFKIQELRKNSVSKIVFLKRVNDENYSLIAIDGFELVSLEDDVKKAIARRVASGNGSFEQGKTYKFVQ